MSSDRFPSKQTEEHNLFSSKWKVSGCVITTKKLCRLGGMRFGKGSSLVSKGPNGVFQLGMCQNRDVRRKKWLLPFGLPCNTSPTRETSQNYRARLRLRLLENIYICPVIDSLQRKQRNITIFVLFKQMEGFRLRCNQKQKHFYLGDPLNQPVKLAFCIGPNVSFEGSRVFVYR